MTNSNGREDDKNNGLKRNETETTNHSMMVGIAAGQIWNEKQTKRLHEHNSQRWPKTADQKTVQKAHQKMPHTQLVKRWGADLA